MKLRLFTGPPCPQCAPQDSTRTKDRRERSVDSNRAATTKYQKRRLVSQFLSARLQRWQETKLRFLHGM